MSAQDILKIIEESLDPDETARQIIMQHPEVKQDVQKLKEIKQRLERAKIIKQVNVGRNNKLKGLLSGKGNELIYNKDDHSNDDLIKECGVEGYHLTSKILQELGFIDNVSYTFTYIDSKGHYHRAGNMNVNLDAVKVEPASSSRGYVSLRFQESVIKQQIALQEQEQEQEALNLHFQKFAQVYYDYQENNNTGWELNKGVLAETFERHWENLNHAMGQGPEQFQRNTIHNDLESEGRRWIMYKMSMGNAAYYTGPDTMYAQVKNANASLIDNINTVLNTMDAVINLVENTINIKELAKNIKKAFFATAPRAQFPKRIWEGLKENVQEEIVEEMREWQGWDNIEIKRISKDNVIFKEA